MVAVFDHKHRTIIRKTFFGRLSIQRRITIAILVAFMLTLPSFSMSFIYFSKLMKQITTVIEQDVKLGRMATDLSLIILDIRRYERNYRIFGRTLDRELAKHLITKAESIINEAFKTAPEPDKETIEVLSSHLSIYSNNFSILIEYISQHPPENRIQQIRAHLTEQFLKFQGDYQNIVTKLDTVSSAQRDSIITHTLQQIDALSLDHLITGKTKDQSSPIQENLEKSRQAFLDTSQNLAEKCWENIIIHKNESQQIEARAKRNIISVLIITLFICSVMIVMLPRRIVRPISSLNLILKKAGLGDLTTEVEIFTHDEIGELASNYNQVLAKLRLYDELKSKKIASQKRIIERLLENFHSPVCIITPNLNALFYNLTFANLFGPSIPPKAPEGGLELETVESLKELAEKVSGKLYSATNEFFIDVIGFNGGKVQLKCRIIRNSVMELESIVIVGVPENPAPK